MFCVVCEVMKRVRAKPQKAERVPKPIAPNPWRRGRRRTGGQGAHATGAGPHDEASTAPSSAPNLRRTRNDDNEPILDGHVHGSAGSNGTARGSNGAAPSSAPPVSPAATTVSGATAAGVVPGNAARPSRQHVIGLFADRASAELACRALADRGYREDAIKLMVSEETCSRYFSDYGDRAVSLAAGMPHLPPRASAVFSHRPRQCPATLDVAIYTTPGENATATLAEILSGSGVSYQRVAEYEAALRTGSVLLSVVTRNPGDARLIEIEWRRSYRAEKVHS